MQVDCLGHYPVIQLTKLLTKPGHTKNSIFGLQTTICSGYKCPVENSTRTTGWGIMYVRNPEIENIIP